MTDAHGRPDAQKSRQELLDEIYYLRDVAGEREARLRAAGPSLAETRHTLDLMLASRSWRWTAPLRALTDWLRRMLGNGQLAQDAVPGGERAQELAVQPEGGQGAQVDVEAAAEIRVDDARCLFVDVTELVLHAGRTGVQRVTREIVGHLLTASPPGYVVEPVYAAPGEPYRLARRLAAELGGRADSPVTEPSMDVRAGDLFVGLDHAMQAVIAHADEFAAWREQGMQVWFSCNDTLPLDHPEWFPQTVPEVFQRWFETLVRVADGVACISRATAADVQRWASALSVVRGEAPLITGCFALGSDPAPEESSAALNAAEQAAIDQLAGRPVFLMVGTVEPRKGHAQALAAFNQLWEQGVDAALVIVGLPGWNTEVIQRRIRHHDESGKCLYWFMGASDALLAKLYATCACLLAPSQGEGFGLPLVEAAQHGLPILCRDLPVFREVAGEFATYFSGDTPESLAQALTGWIEASRQGQVPSTQGMPRATWAESAQQLMSLILHDGSGLGPDTPEQGVENT